MPFVVAGKLVKTEELGFSGSSEGWRQAYGEGQTDPFVGQIKTIENTLLTLTRRFVRSHQVKILLVRAQYVLHFGFRQHRILFEWPENPLARLRKQFSRSSQYFARRQNSNAGP
jgi:hypothetical protein